MIMNGQPNLSFLDINMNQRNNYCPFVRTGSLAVAWHGGVEPLSTASPLLQLLFEGLEEILPPLRIRTASGTIPEGDLAAAGLCGLSGAGEKI